MAFFTRLVYCRADLTFTSLTSSFKSHSISCTVTLSNSSLHQWRSHSPQSQSLCQSVLQTRDYLQWRIIQINDHKKTLNLDTFIKVTNNNLDRARVVAYKHLRNWHTLNTSLVQQMRLVVKNDASHLWDFTDLADALLSIDLPASFKSKILKEFPNIFSRPFTYGSENREKYSEIMANVHKQIP